MLVEAYNPTTNRSRSAMGEMFLNLQYCICGIGSFTRHIDVDFLDCTCRTQAAIFGLVYGSYSQKLFSYIRDRPQSDRNVILQIQIVRELMSNNMSNWIKSMAKDLLP